ALPFFVTLQLRVNPAFVSAVLGSVTVLPSEICVPSGLDAGAPVIAAVGATLVTFSVNVVVLLTWPSFAVIVTVGLAGPSSGDDVAAVGCTGAGRPAVEDEAAGVRDRVHLDRLIGFDSDAPRTRAVDVLGRVGEVAGAVGVLRKVLVRDRGLSAALIEVRDMP